MDNIYFISDLNKLTELKYKKKPIIAQFYTDWCPPCKQARILLEKELKNGANFILACVNCDEAQELNIEFDIEGVPTLIHVSGETMKPVNKVVGLDVKGIKEFLTKACSAAH